MKKAISIFSIFFLCLFFGCRVPVEVLVTDALTKQPISGAAITNSCTNKVKTTNGSGVVNLKTSKGQKCDFTIAKQGYTTTSVSNTGSAKQNILVISLSKVLVVPPAPPVVDNTSQLTQLICTGNKPSVQEKSEISVNQERKEEPNPDGVFFPCKYETWKKVDKYEDIISLNPLNDVIWTGAVIQGKNLIQGMPASINLLRNPTTITLTGLNYADNKPNSIQIDNPSKATIDEGVRQIMRDRNKPVTQAGIGSDIIQVYSYEHALMTLGLSAKWSWGELGSQLNSKFNQTKNTFVFSFVQRYYSISCPSPSSSGSVFQKNTTLSQLSPYVNSENPPCLITNVTFGRQFFLSISSTESESSIKAALELKFKGLGVKGETNLSYEAERILRESEISIFAIGGSAPKIAEVIVGVRGKDKFETLSNYIIGGAEWSPESPGVPISYKAVFLCDNSQAAVNSTTEFKIRTCSTVSYKKPFTIKVNEWIMRDVTDDDEDMNFGYKITFYDQRGNMVSGKEYSNHRGSTYVEEVGKVGLKNDKNRFFYNEPIFSISDLAIFKIKIEIRVNTEDGDCDRPWKRNPFWVKEIDVSSLASGEYSISPWDAMDFKFTHN